MDNGTRKIIVEALQNLEDRIPVAIYGVKGICFECGPFEWDTHTVFGQAAEAHYRRSLEDIQPGTSPFFHDQWQCSFSGIDFVEVRLLAMTNNTPPIELLLNEIRSLIDDSVANFASLPFTLHRQIEIPPDHPKGESRVPQRRVRRRSGTGTVVTEFDSTPEFIRDPASHLDGVDSPIWYFDLVIRDLKQCLLHAHELEQQRKAIMPEASEDALVDSQTPPKPDKDKKRSGKGGQKGEKYVHSLIISAAFTEHHNYPGGEINYEPVVLAKMSRDLSEGLKRSKKPRGSDEKEEVSKSSTITKTTILRFLERQGFSSHSEYKKFCEDRHETKLTRFLDEISGEGIGLKEQSNRGTQLDTIKDEHGSPSEDEEHGS
ncbi:hypothetical protein [Rhodopirellula europaea]|uniref:Uncharacterized protein n=1 Tax=Rhodopirellula europaea 6C TaxID=1263867 RepID=M2AX83_9BACT|nr:hypothetical protein [Rhodopirellula europaea]EMB14579.1 hypothetical protein RE6C_05001 [Rhodopirellula europaea 6C]